MPRDKARENVATLADPRWAAVLARDATADGRFYYAVRSTGVYCRPSCGARTPRPENVEFHPSIEAAEAAGFRPCRRCRPDLPPAAQRQAAMVAQLCRFIDAAEHPPRLQELADHAGISPHHLHRLFKAVTGLTPRAYAAARRAARVRDRLAAGETATAALYGAGYGSSGPFYTEADAILGMKPRDFRSGGAACVIRFAISRCSLGTILVAASDRGICAILLGDEPVALTGDLQRRFPLAKLLEGDGEFEAWVTAVVAFVEAPQFGLDLPLDLQGTAFQQRVWLALRQIPLGKTITYAELARRLGKPRGARAVAGACAANPLAVVIPCHRVVRGDGDLAGYRWGIERKRTLLQREALEEIGGDER